MEFDQMKDGIDTDLEKLEEELSSLVPHGMPEDLISRMDDAMCRWHETVPLEEKVISIQPTQETSQKNQPKRSWFSWSDAAAVALLGAASALWMTQSGNHEMSTAQQTVMPFTTSEIVPSSFKPLSTEANVVGATQRGITRLADGSPARCVEVEVSQQMSFINDAGERVILKNPQVEILLMPIQTD